MKSAKVPHQSPLANCRIRESVAPHSVRVGAKRCRKEAGTEGSRPLKAIFRVWASRVRAMGSHCGTGS